ncbi:RDD family protein [Actinoplanes sp. NPDC049802]|uniref:RDD family protein n=1 Tax=Actinoplanes sp. NPDC049802 TaxID=3154742 RepID=UPI0033DBE034
MSQATVDATHSQVETTRRLVSPAGRLGAQVIDGLLIGVTAGIGWLVWASWIFERGQTPARQILGHVVADARTGLPVAWSRMAYRELFLKFVCSYVFGAVTLGIFSLIDALMVFGDRHRTLHDRMADTIVIYR